MKESDIDPVLNTFRGAKVQIADRNFEPDWGLFNGAVGKVVEIVYNENTSPLGATCPQFIIVDFPTYQGSPRRVPSVMILYVYLQQEDGTCMHTHARYYQCTISITYSSSTTRSTHL